MPNPETAGSPRAHVTHATHANVPYGPHERQVFDIWLAPSRFPGAPTPLYLYIHGGGFSNGNKNELHHVMRERLLAAGVSVASTNYRFTSDPEYLACLHDPKRALQLIRHNAAKWNLDKTRVGAGGSSAGAATAFWLGFGPERADPTSDDPIARESTLLQCITSADGQTSLDPAFLKKEIAGPTWTIASIQALTRLTLKDYDTPRAREVFKEFAFTEHVTRISPPVFQYNLTPGYPMTDDLSIGNGIHHPRLAYALKEIMDPLGVECVVRTREEVIDLTDKEAEALLQREAADFVIRQLKK